MTEPQVEVDIDMLEAKLALADVESLILERKRVDDDYLNACNEVYTPEQRAALTDLHHQGAVLEDKMEEVGVYSPEQQTLLSQIQALQADYLKSYKAREKAATEKMAKAVLKVKKPVRGSMYEAQIEPGKRSGATVLELETAAQILPPEFQATMTRLIKPAKDKVVLVPVEQ